MSFFEVFWKDQTNCTVSALFFSPPSLANTNGSTEKYRKTMKIVSRENREPGNPPAIFQKKARGCNRPGHVPRKNREVLLNSFTRHVIFHFVSVDIYIFLNFMLEGLEEVQPPPSGQFGYQPAPTVQKFCSAGTAFYPDRREHREAAIRPVERGARIAETFAI